MMHIEGIFVPVITPFKDERIDFEAVEHNFEIWNQSKVSGYVIMGSTSEFPSLLHDEKIELMVLARRRIPKEKKMLVGAGCHSVFETVRLAQKAAEIDADGLLVITPYYYKSRITTLLLRHYYLGVANQVSLPVYIYHIPQFSGTNLSVELVKVLCGHERIVGVKDSTGDLSRVFEMTNAEEEINVLVGDVNSLVAALMMGADGAILAFANAFPGEFCEIYRLTREGQVDQALERMHPLLSLAKSTIGKFGIPGLKVLMEFMNYRPGAPRMPFSKLDAKQREQIQRAYEQYTG